MPDLRDLPFDNTYARLGQPFGRRVEPTPLTNPRAVAWNPDAAELLGIDPGEAERPFWVEAFGGSAPLPGAEPLAMLYAGHQFGAWVPQLGDGRAILLGEVGAPSGKWDLHLKGGGVTPFSRGFDGRAVLRSTIREYLGSEAVHGLGIPTTRALCIVGSDELWNLGALAQALLPLVERDRAAAALNAYEPAFADAYMAGLRAKLGLREARGEDGELAGDLLELLAASRVDFTRFWRLLGTFSGEEGSPEPAIRDLFLDRAGWEAWAERYRARLRAEGSDAAERRARMDAVNPAYVLRNYLAERAIRLAEDERDFGEIERLRALLRDPFTERPGMEAYAGPPPEWGRRLVVSCSS